MDAAVLREAVASLYEDTPDSVVMYDRDGLCIVANEAARLLTGFSIGEYTGTPYARHISPADLERVDLAFRTALAGGTDHFDTSAKHKDGTVIPVECYVFPAQFNGAVVGVFAQARDIVALRSAELSLTINQEKFRSLFEYHPDGIMELKESGLVSRINVALESETGFYVEQVVGKAWTELIAPELRADAEELLREAARGEATERDSMLLDRLGNKLDVQLKLVPLHVGGDIRGAYAIFKNIAAQKTAERTIASQSERIRRLYMVAASRIESLDEQIEATLGLGLDLFAWDEGYITHVTSDRVHVRNAVGANVVTKGTIYPPNVALSTTLSDGRPHLLIEDLDAPDWRNSPARATAPWRSYFAVPLTVGGHLYGGLAFASRMPRSRGSRGG